VKETGTCVVTRLPDRSGDILIARYQLRRVHTELETSGDGYITLTVYGSTAKRFDTVLQKFTARADDGEINGIFYDIVIYGCCGGENRHTVYNWSTGRPVAMYSGEKFPQAVGPHAHISYLSSNAVFSERYLCTGCIGVLTLWNDDGPMDRLQVKSDIEPWTPDISLLGPRDAGDKGGHPGHFSVRLEFQYHEGDDVVVPVDQGRFVLKDAAVPRDLGMTLARVPLLPTQKAVVTHKAAEPESRNQP
jgi:hypothetical protein